MMEKKIGKIVTKVVVGESILMVLMLVFLVLSVAYPKLQTYFFCCLNGVLCGLVVMSLILGFLVIRDIRGRK